MLVKPVHNTRFVNLAMTDSTLMVLLVFNATTNVIPVLTETPANLVKRKMPSSPIVNVQLANSSIKNSTAIHARTDVKPVNPLPSVTPVKMDTTLRTLCASLVWAIVKPV